MSFYVCQAAAEDNNPHFSTQLHQATGELGVNTSHNEAKKERKKVCSERERAGNVNHQSFIMSVSRPPSVFLFSRAAAFTAADLCTSQPPHSSQLYAQDGHRSPLHLHSHCTSIFFFYKVGITFLKGGGGGAASHCRSRKTLSVPW